MTCREKLAIEHPEDICEDYNGSCAKCPHDYGYLDKPISCGFPTPILKQIRCDDCWDREIPENNEKEKTSMTNTKKTKAMLQEEVEQLYQELMTKEKELAKFDKYKKYEEMGNELFAALTAMKDAGFTHDEAFILLKTAVGNGISN